MKRSNLRLSIAAGVFALSVFASLFLLAQPAAALQPCYWCISIDICVDDQMLGANGCTVECDGAICECKLFGGGCWRF